MAMKALHEKRKKEKAEKDKQNEQYTASERANIVCLFAHSEWHRVFHQ